MSFGAQLVESVILDPVGQISEHYEHEVTVPVVTHAFVQAGYPVVGCHAMVGGVIPQTSVSAQSAIGAVIPDFVIAAGA